MKQKSIAKTSLIVLLVTIIVKIFGFLREIAVGYFGGTTAITDAYNIASVIPNFFLVVITQVVLIAFIPIIHSIQDDTGHERNDFTSKCVILLFSISAIFAIIIALFPKFWVNVFASGMNQETKEITVSYLRIGASVVLFQSVSIVLSSYLNAFKRFLVPIVCGLILDAFTVVFFALQSKTGNYLFVGFIQIANAIAKMILLLVAAKKAGFRFRFQKKIFDKNIRQILFISIPALISVGVYEINVLVDKNFASFYGEGAISSLTYAQTINNVFYTLITNSIITVAYSHISELHAQNKKQEAMNLFASSFRTILFIALPLSLVTILFSKQIITVVFMRGKFDEQSVLLTYKNLTCYVAGLTFLSISLLTTRFLYAHKNQYPAIIISAISLAANILFNFIMYKYTSYGVSSIALATSLSAGIQAILLLSYVLMKYRFNKKAFFTMLSRPLILTVLFCPIIGAVEKTTNEITNIYIRTMLILLLLGLGYLLLLCFFEPLFAKKIKSIFLRKKIQVK